ncbi:hypothetical protein P9078_12235, partial [Gallibacterium anatis]
SAFRLNHDFHQIMPLSLPPILNVYWASPAAFSGHSKSVLKAKIAHKPVLFHTILMPLPLGSVALE